MVQEQTANSPLLEALAGTACVSGLTVATYFPGETYLPTPPMRQFPMTFRELLLAFFLIIPTLKLQAQTPPPTPKPSPDVVAGIPVNYDEAKVGTYSLADPLTLHTGNPVRGARTC